MRDLTDRALDTATSLGATYADARIVRRLDRVPAGQALGRLRGAVPLVAAVLVFGFGIYLTVQAVGGTPTL
jgi:hypothetical protein